MLYSEFIEKEYQKILEVFDIYKSKSTSKQKNKIDKARISIKAKRLSLVRGKETTGKKKKSEEELHALANKSARRIFSKKLMGKIYDDLNDQERIEFNKRKNNKKEAYKRLKDEEYRKLKSKYNKSSFKDKNGDKDKTER